MDARDGISDTSALLALPPDRQPARRRVNRRTRHEARCTLHNFIQQASSLTSCAVVARAPIHPVGSRSTRRVPAPPAGAGDPTGPPNRLAEADDRAQFATAGTGAGMVTMFVFLCFFVVLFLLFFL